MRTTLDLPDDILRRAKIAAVERGSSMRQLVIDALRREMDAPAGKSRRLATAPVKLAHDSPLRRLSPQEVKQIDTAAEHAEDLRRARALHR